MSYANNKGPDHPAHSRSLISACVVRCLDSIIPLVSISEIPGLYLASVAAHAGLCLTWSQTPKTGFLVTRLIYISFESIIKRHISKITHSFKFSLCSNNDNERKANRKLKYKKKKKKKVRPYAESNHIRKKLKS